MPATTARQAAFMRFVEHSPEMQKKTGISASVAKEFNHTDVDEDPDLGTILDNGMLSVEQISPNISMNDAGFLICTNAVIARTGVQDYLASEIPNVEPGSDGKVKSIRTADEVFRPESIASFNGAPLTMGHPPTGKITAEDWKRYAVGTVTNAHQDGLFLKADLIIHDAATIKQIQEKGIKFLSCGYGSRLEDNKDGTVNQTFIKGNHVAITDSPRAGEMCQINDSLSNSINRVNDSHSQIGKNMAQKQKIQKSFFSWLFNDSVDDDLPVPLDIKDEDPEDMTDEDHEKVEDKTYAELIKRIEALEALNKTEETKVTDEDAEDKTDVTDEDPEDKTEVKDEDEDLKDEDADGEYTVNDSLPTVLSNAEILVPGIKLNKSATPNLIDLKRQTLVKAFLTDSTVKELSGGRDISAMKPQAVDILFNSAVKIKASLNNTAIKSTILNDSAQKPTDGFAALRENFAKLNSK